MSDYTNDIETIKDAGFNRFLSRTDFSLQDMKSKYVSASNIAGGELGSNTVINIGSKLVRIDGRHGRIIINDGTNDRIIIGNLD